MNASNHKLFTHDINIGDWIKDIETNVDSLMYLSTIVVSMYVRNFENIHMKST